MSTSDEIVSDSLRLLGVKSAETPLSATELSDGRRSLNRMAAQLEADGYELGFTTLATGTDEVTIPAYAEDFFINQLAVRLAPEYETEITASIVESVKASRATVVRKLNAKLVGQTGTYQDIIYGAFVLLGASSGRMPISTTDISNGMPLLNDLMLDLESKGFHLSYNVNTSTTLTGSHGLPDWCNSWVKGLLAMNMASSIGLPITEAVGKAVIDGEKNAYMRLYDAPTVDLPETLPTGGRWEHFFGDPTRDALLTGSGEFLLDNESDILTGEYDNE